MQWRSPVDASELVFERETTLVNLSDLLPRNVQDFRTHSTRLVLPPDTAEPHRLHCAPPNLPGVPDAISALFRVAVCPGFGSSPEAEFQVLQPAEPRQATLLDALEVVRRCRFFFLHSLSLGFPNLGVSDRREGGDVNHSIDRFPAARNTDGSKCRAMMLARRSTSRSSSAAFPYAVIAISTNATINETLAAAGPFSWVP